jgi:hypothetical protein
VDRKTLAGRKLFIKVISLFWREARLDGGHSIELDSRDEATSMPSRGGGTLRSALPDYFRETRKTVNIFVLPVPGKLNGACTQMTNNVECVRESGALSIARRLAYATYSRKRSVESTSYCAASIPFLEHRNIAPVTNGSFFAGVIVRVQRDGHIMPFNLFSYIPLSLYP